MDTINKTLAQAYLDMYETKTKRESWVPEAVADEDVADFMGAAAAAAKAGKKEFKFGDKTYKVTMKKSTVDAINDETEEACPDCGKVHEGSCMKESLEELDEAAKFDKEMENVLKKMGYKPYKKKYDFESDKWVKGNIGIAVLKKGKAFAVSKGQQTIQGPTDVAKLADYMKGLKEETLDESPEEPRAKGEKEFKKMHDDNIEINDEEKNDEENFKNIKKSADAIKK